MAGEDKVYTAWVRTRPCSARSMANAGDCFGGVQAHHAGRDRGLSQRAHDDTCIPLCVKHHQDWHSAAGPFRPLDKERRRQWSEQQIGAMRRLWAAVLKTRSRTEPG